MNMLELTLQRLWHDSQSTIGLLFIDGVRMCWILEDEPRAVKVHGETRIPAARYEIIQDQPSSKDEKYRVKLKAWGMKYYGMLRLKNVVGFQGILIHTGNYETHTDGCLLTGTTAGTDDRGYNAVYDSNEAFKKIYPIISGALQDGRRVFITIKDESV